MSVRHTKSLREQGVARLVFEPQPDITAYEMALIFKSVRFHARGTAPAQMVIGKLEDLPETVKRHFRRE